jgi:predicted transcriptional regulator
MKTRLRLVGYCKEQLKEEVAQLVQQLDRSESWIVCQAVSKYVKRTLKGSDSLASSDI